MSDVTLFDAFWQATGELPFEALTGACAECYRLSIRTSLRREHKVVRMQQPPPGSQEVPRLVVHFFVFGPDRNSASAATNEIALEEAHWHALDALLAVANFWEMSEEARGGLDGSMYTLEAWKDGRTHKVSRWSPNAVVPGGELFAVVTDYMERLAELAMFECELYERYGPPGYVPRHRLLPRGNMG
jgi:hypothetical protein